MKFIKITDANGVEYIVPISVVRLRKEKNSPVDGGIEYTADVDTEYVTLSKNEYKKIADILLSQRSK